MESNNKVKTFFDNTWHNIKAAFSAPHIHRERDDGELFTERTRPRLFALSVMFTTIKAVIVLVLLVGCAGLGLVLGIAKAYIETTPDLDISLLTKSDRTSYIYDKDGNLITTYAGMEYRDWVDIEDVPDMLINALIAVEDVRFYKHDGVDYKRLFSAVVNTLRNADTHGGSTLTQQLVKNKLLSNEQSYKRKIQEAYLAMEVENTITKDDILEAYMNDVYLGDSNYGMKTAARDYFGKDLSELSIRECAMLAGMVQKPYETNPRANTYTRKYTDGEKAGRNKMDITDERTNTVIERMYEAGFITEEQRQTALKDTVYILEKSEQKQIYDMPYFVEYGVRDVITHLLKKRGLLDTTANRSAIENELKRGGYYIYLTVDTELQHTVQGTLATYEDYPGLKNSSAAVKVTTNTDGTTMEVVQPQAAAVVIDYHTGELRAIVGGRNSPQRKKEWNRAYQSNMPVGSSIKPIAVYGPALDTGLSPASVIMNLPFPIEGYGGTVGFPAIGSEKYIGPVTIRRGIVSSLNVVAARTLFEHVTTAVSKQYLVDLGVDPSRINEDGPGLALGTTGITPIEMAAAYSTIASGGVYTEPLSFTRVVNDKGEVILDADEVRESHRVFKETTAYLLIDMLTNAVQSGTGTSAKIDGMTVAGKTGTNSDYTSAYFAGMTPYYVATLWVGHDDYSQKLESGSTGGKAAAPLWQKFMEPIHEGLVDKPIMDVSPASIGLVKRTVCSVSGKLATEACQFDPDGHTPVTDWFVKENAPTETCDMHVVANVCTASNMIASVYCPAESVVQQSVVVINSQSQFMRCESPILLQYMHNIVYSDIPIDQITLTQTAGAVCNVHSTPWGTGLGQSYDLDTLTYEASLISSEVQSYLASVQNLPDTHKTTLETGMNSVRYYLQVERTEELYSAITQLRYNYGVIKEAYPPVSIAP